MPYTASHHRDEDQNEHRHGGPGDRESASDDPGCGDDKAESLRQFRPPLSIPAVCVLRPARARIEERVRPRQVLWFRNEI